MSNSRRDTARGAFSKVGIVARTFLSVAVYGLLLFVPAWTLDWWRGWVLLALVFVTMLITRFWVFGRNAGLLDERRKSPMQAGQPRADKAVVIGFVTVFPAFIAFIPLDVFRFHLLGKPGAVVSSLGLVLFVAGWWIITLAFRENAFAAAIVKHQDDRRQRVVDTGVYAIVRHPLYSGVVLIVVGVALWLQSYAAAILSVAPIAVLVLRIFVEEAFLTEELSGYATYKKRVGHRLVPRLW